MLRPSSRSVRVLQAAPLLCRSTASVSRRSIIPTVSTPLTSPHPLLRPQLEEPPAEVLKGNVEFTSLDNGLRVATLDSENPFSGLSLYVKAGSRYEGSKYRGASHFLKHFAYTRTQTRSPVRVSRDMELATADFNTSVSREYITYSAQLLHDNVGEVVWMLSDLLTTTIPEYKVREIAEKVDVESAVAEQDANTLLVETLHREAYRDAGLGNSIYCPSYRVHSVSDTVIADYLQQRYVPGNMLLVGVGVKHNNLVTFAKDHFGGLKAGEVKADSPAKYEGGEVRIPTDGDTRLAVAFEGVGLADKDIYALDTLTALTGGGVKRSRDGPGFGVRSRLYRNIVANQDAVLAAATLQASYSDSGLWGLYVHVQPGHVAQAFGLLEDQIGQLSQGSIDDAEVQRAKNQAKGSLLRQVETRAGLVDFLARQAFATAAGGKLVSPSDYAARIDAVTKADVANVAKRLLRSGPTVVCTGDVLGLPTRSRLQSKLPK